MNQFQAIQAMLDGQKMSVLSYWNNSVIRFDFEKNHFVSDLGTRWSFSENYDNWEVYVEPIKFTGLVEALEHMKKGGAARLHRSSSCQETARDNQTVYGWLAHSGICVIEDPHNHKTSSIFIGGADKLFMSLVSTGKNWELL